MRVISEKLRCGTTQFLFQCGKACLSMPHTSEHHHRWVKFKRLLGSCLRIIYPNHNCLPSGKYTITIQHLRMLAVSCLTQRPGGKEENTSLANPDHPRHGGLNWRKLKCIYLCSGELKLHGLQNITIRNNYQWHLPRHFPRYFPRHLRWPIHSSLKREQTNSNDFWHGKSDFVTF